MTTDRTFRFYSLIPQALPRITLTLEACYSQELPNIKAFSANITLNIFLFQFLNDSC